MPVAFIRGFESVCENLGGYEMRDNLLQIEGLPDNMSSYGIDIGVAQSSLIIPSLLSQFSVTVCWT